MIIRATALIQIEAATCTGPRTAVNSTAASRKRSSVLRKSLYSGRYRAHGSGGRGRSAEAVSSADPLQPPSAHARARSRRCRLAAAQVPATKPPSSLQPPVRRNSGSDGRENGQLTFRAEPTQRAASHPIGLGWQSEPVERDTCAWRGAFERRTHSTHRKILLLISHPNDRRRGHTLDREDVFFGIWNRSSMYSARIQAKAHRAHV